MNLIRADLYRLFRSKGIYICFSIIILFLILVSYGQSGSIGVQVSGEELGQETNQLKLIGQNAPFIVIGSIDNNLYLLLAIIILIAGIDFSNKTVKNTISFGITRKKYYLSKFILSNIFAFVVVLLIFVIPLILTTILNGFGEKPNTDYWIDLIIAFGLEYLMFVAMSSLCLFYLFSTRRIAFTNSLFIGSCMVPTIIILILFSIDKKFNSLFKYEPIINMRSVSNITNFSNIDYIKFVMIALVIILISFLGTYLNFRKCDIK
jgi:ABC-2 type transport system permease protein